MAKRMVGCRVTGGELAPRAYAIYEDVPESMSDDAMATQIDDLTALNPCADIEKSLSDFRVAGGKLSEAQDALLELRAAFVQAWGFEPGPENALYRPTLDKVDAALGSVNADAPAPFSEASQNYAERDPSVMAD